MNGELVGHWRQLATGVQQFAYAEEWLSNPAVRPISLSLPLRPQSNPYRKGVTEFFENLLPDNRTIRERIQHRFRARSTGAFDLLQEIGRDCVGALQLLPDGHRPENLRTITAEPLNAKGIAAILANAVNPQFGRSEHLDDTFRISLAGAQEKIALLKAGNKWQRPLGSTPTTHILKLPMGANAQGIDLSTSVENEWLCAQLASGYGIPVAPCWIERFGDQKILIVERFDRALAETGLWYLRLPQEDFCQATSTPSASKYESDGGPGIEAIMELLLGSENAVSDRREFMKTQIVFWLLAAIDGHAKNFSIFLKPGGDYCLTPRYDILSAYPVLGHGRNMLSPQKIKMAMAVSGKNRHYQWKEISAHHWLSTAKRCGFSEMKEVMEEAIDRTPELTEKAMSRLPSHFPLHVADAIISGTRKAAKVMAEQLAKHG